jgi:hypothetical protein
MKNEMLRDAKQISEPGPALGETPITTEDESQGDMWKK